MKVLKLPCKDDNVPPHSTLTKFEDAHHIWAILGVGMEGRVPNYKVLIYLIPKTAATPQKLIVRFPAGCAASSPKECEVVAKLLNLDKLLDYDLEFRYSHLVE
jgi:hypothetical protein